MEKKIFTQPRFGLVESDSTIHWESDDADFGVMLRRAQEENKLGIAVQYLDYFSDGSVQYSNNKSELFLGKNSTAEGFKERYSNYTIHFLSIEW